MTFMRQFILLPKEELLAALVADNKDQLCIGVRVAFHTMFMVEMLLADGRTLLVHTKDFKDSGDGTSPDFDNMRPTDYGQTLALGPYEAAVDHIIKKTAEKYPAA